MFTPNREELAWAAGFYDGEGSTFHKWNGYKSTVTGITNTYPSLYVSVVQRDRRPIDRFQQAVGGIGNINEYMIKGKPMYRWNVTKFEYSQAVIAMLWCFLSEPKREQAVRAITPVLEYRRARDLHKLVRMEVRRVLREELQVKGKAKK